MDDLSISEMIELLYLVCPCGECDGVWVTRHEADRMIAVLRDYDNLIKSFAGDE